MRLLIHSPAFPPSIGGLERVTENLADGLARLGDDVVVVTSTPGRDEPALPYRVARRPGARAHVELVRWSEVVLHQNVSLKGLWPLGIVRRPLVVGSQGTYRRPGGRRALRDRWKLAVLRRATASIAASRFVADDLSVPSVVVPNCYDDSLFRILGAPERRGDLLFVGRLVSDKGVSVLVDAVRRLVASGTNPSLTIVGAGPEEPALRAQAAALGIGPRVRFAGALSGEALVEEYNRHRYVVVPSVWEEPFGIVALEAIACGCIPVVSDGGGLPEAAGNCGVVFRRGDSTSLADVLAGLESDGARREALALGRPAHLERHRRDVMSRAYREVLVNACGRSRVAEAP